MQMLELLLPGMNQLVGGFAKAFGQGLAEGLGAAIVLVVLIGLAIFLVGGLLAIIFGLLSWRFYRKKRPRAFAIVSSVSAFFASLIISIILSSKIWSDASAILPLFVIFFVGSIILIRRGYKKIKPPVA